MKVQTDLKAGATLATAAQQASSAVNAAAGDVANFASAADQQAAALTSSVVNSATNFWNCLTGA